MKTRCFIMFHLQYISISYPYHIPHPAIPNATGGRECGRAHESPAERRQRREPGCDANATERGFPVFPPSKTAKWIPPRLAFLGYISTSRIMQGVNDLKLLDDGSYGYFFKIGVLIEAPSNPQDHCRVVWLVVDYVGFKQSFGRESLAKLFSL